MVEAEATDVAHMWMTPLMFFITVYIVSVSVALR